MNRYTKKLLMMVMLVSASQEVYANELAIIAPRVAAAYIAGIYSSVESLAHLSTFGLGVPEFARPIVREGQGVLEVVQAVPRGQIGHLFKGLVWAAAAIISAKYVVSTLDATEEEAPSKLNRRPRSKNALENDPMPYVVSENPRKAEPLKNDPMPKFRRSRLE